MVSKLEDDLTKAHGEIDRVVLGRRAEGTALMQAEAYRQENARLLGMLAETKEYSNFAKLALDSGESGVRYMESSKSEEPAASASTHDMKAADESEAESEKWIPEDAFKVAHDFRAKCAANVSKSMMNTLLQDLNKIWRAREKKQLSRVKSTANSEVAYMRRAVAFRKPYD